MSKDKETKKLNAEELEKRVAPFAEPITTRTEPVDPAQTGGGGGGFDKPVKK